MNKVQQQTHINRIYGSTPNTPKQGQSKMFQRRQIRNNNQRRFSRSKKQKQVVQQKICFVPSFMKTSEIYRLFRSKSSNLKHDNQSQTQQFSSRTRVLSNQSQSVSPFKKTNKLDYGDRYAQQQKLKQETLMKQQILKQRKQIQQLRQKNIALTKEINIVKYEKTVQLKNVDKLNQRLKVLNDNQAKFRKKFEQKNVQIRGLKKIIQDQKVQINKLEQAVIKKQKQIKQLLNEKKDQNLQIMVSQIHKNFDDMFIQNRSPDIQSLGGFSRLQLQFDTQNYIHELQQKIKTQQLQIHMLKRYKSKVQKYQKQLQTQKIQNKLLMTKIMSLPKQGQKLKVKKKGFQQSISFQLSKDQQIHT